MPKDTHPANLIIFSSKEYLIGGRQLKNINNEVPHINWKRVVKQFGVTDLSSIKLVILWKKQK